MFQKRKDCRVFFHKPPARFSRISTLFPLPVYLTNIVPRNELLKKDFRMYCERIRATNLILKWFISFIVQEEYLTQLKLIKQTLHLHVQAVHFK